MRSDMVSELRLATLYANQVARAIVRMDDRPSNFFFNAMQSTHNTFAIDLSTTIDVLDIPGLETTIYSFRLETTSIALG